MKEFRNMIAIGDCKVSTEMLSKIPMQHKLYRQRQRGSKFHMTIAEKGKLKEPVTEGRVYQLGLGFHSDCYFIVCGAPDLQLQLEKSGLDWKDFHITLGYKTNDVHDITKNPSTLIFHELSNLEQILPCLTAYYKLLGESRFRNQLLGFSYQLIDYYLIHADEKLKALLLSHKSFLLYTEKKYLESYFTAADAIKQNLSGEGLVRLIDTCFKLKYHQEALFCSWKLVLIDGLDSKLINYGWTKLHQLWKIGMVFLEEFESELGLEFTQNEFNQYRILRYTLPKPFEPCNQIPVSPRNRVKIESYGMTLPRFFSWLVPLVIAGMSTPKSEADINLLAALGFGVIISLTEEQPLNECWFEKSKVKHYFWPVSNYYPPSLGQVHEFIKLVVQNRAKSEAKSVLVHCGGGKGRAGCFLATYLICYGFSVAPDPCDQCMLDPAIFCDNVGCAFHIIPKLTAQEAIEQLRNIRPGSIETERQEVFLKEYAEQLWKNYRTGTRKYSPLRNDPLVKGLLKRTGEENKSPKILLLCGLPGSGKSYFAEQIKVHKGYSVISQDELGGKQEFVSALSSQNISQCNKSGVIIDKCNSTKNDRMNILELIGSNVPLTVVYFNVDPIVCLERIQARLTHPTLKASRGKGAITSFSKIFEPPQLSDTIKTIYEINNFADSNTLLEYFGIPHATSFFKYPRTRHIINVGSVSRDDLCLPENEFADFIDLKPDEILTIQEKVDGANIGFRILDGKIVCQNRSHYVTHEDHPQFRELPRWIRNHNKELAEILVDHILFGEWMAAQHSISYDELPDFFVAFDLYCISKGRFYSYQKFCEILEKTSIACVPCINYDGIPAKDNLVSMLEKGSKFSTNALCEGIIVRVDSGDYLVRKGKVVRTDFIHGDKHWTKLKYQENSIKRL